MNALRNPILELAAGRRLESLPPEAKVALAAVLAELAEEADRLAEISWSKRKGPMAAYWRAVSTYAKHIGRAVRRPDRRPGWQARALLHRGTATFEGPTVIVEDHGLPLVEVGRPETVDEVVERYQGEGR